MSKFPEYFYRLFKSVKTLEEFFKESFTKLSPEENSLLEKLSKDILVISPNESHDIYSRWQTYNSKNLTYRISLNESNRFPQLSNILNNLVMFMKKDWKVNNVLASGLIVISPYHREILSQFDENTVLNNIKNNEAWNILLSCVGEESFCKIFLDNIILQKLPNNTFYQISGESISKNLSLKKVSKVKKGPKPNYKSTFLLDINSDRSEISKYFNNILSTKKRRNDKVEPSPKIPRRVRKKLRLEIEKKEEKKKQNKSYSNKVDIIERERMFFAESVINRKTEKPLMALTKEHIFHPYQGKGIEYAVHCASKIFPEEFRNTRKGKAFLKRFNDIPHIIEHIHARHSKTSCFDILNINCPIKVSIKDVSDASSTYKEVTRFITHILKKVFPLRFWGSKDNYDTIQKVVYNFISRSKKESLTMQEVMHKFKLKQCSWLDGTSKSTVLIPSDFKKRQAILYKMFHWLFHGYIIPVVKSMFYCTESEKNAQKLIYFRHDVWHKLSQEILPSILSNNYIPIDKDLLLTLKIGVARIRLLPKGSGFRMITNMKNTIKYTKREEPSKLTASQKDVLVPVLNVLKYQKERNPSLMGSSVMGSNMFYKRLKDYKMNQLDEQKFYFVKIDIKNCFDTIDQTRLISLLTNILISEKAYVGRTVTAVQSLGNRMVKRNLTFSTPRDKEVNVCDQLTQFSDIKRDAIIVDQDQYKIDATEEIIGFLEESVCMNVVKVGNEFYKRKNGIPQGSTLSTLLCSLYFGEFEKEKLSFLNRDPTGILFSYVDDFLYITKNKGYAKWFKNVMIHEIKRYGLTVNANKCVTNIDTEMDKFYWLGYQLNTKNLDVSLDLPTLNDIRSSVITKFIQHPREKLYADCIRSIKTRYSPILMDPNFNTKQTVHHNLYQVFYITALRMESQATALARGIYKFNNEDLLFEIIIRLAHFVIPIKPFNTSSHKIVQLLFQAFLDAFITRPTRYTKLMYCLKQMLKGYSNSMTGKKRKGDTIKKNNMKKKRIDQ